MNVLYRQARVLLFLLWCVLAPAFCFAENPDESSPVAQVTAEERDAQLNELFFSAFGSIQTGDLATGAEKLEELKNLAFTNGYRNLSHYSFLLLERAAQLPEVKVDEFGFLIRRAEALSPSDARVLLEITRHYPRVSFSDCAGYFSRALGLVFNFPSVVMGGMAELTLLTLVVLTLSLLFVAAVQLAVSCAELLEGIGDLLPRSVWGLLGPVVFLAVLLIPLWFGILPSLVVWSLVLSFFIKPCRWLSLFVGLTAFGWGLALPVIGVVMLHSNSTLEQELEQSNNGAVVPGLLEKLLRLTPATNESVIKATAVVELDRAGRDSEAEVLAKQIFAHPKLLPELEYALAMNRGIAALRHGRFDDAKGYFERAQQKDETFAVIYYLSRVSISLTDLTAHQQYYSTLRDLDEKLLDKLEADENIAGALLPSSLPSSIFYKRFFTPFDLVDRGAAESQRELTEFLAQTLMRWGSPSALVMLGMIALIATGLIRWHESRKLGRSQRRRAFSRDGAAPGAIWLLLPGGALATGRTPVFGGVVLSVCLALLAMAFNFPAPFPVLSAFVSPFKISVVVFAGAVLLISAFAAGRARRVTADSFRRV